MVMLDIRNSRMKDFYDIWFMANTWTFDMASLRNAIVASFERRGSTIPTGIPFALTEDIPERSAEEAAMGCIREPTGLRRHDSVS